MKIYKFHLKDKKFAKVLASDQHHAKLILELDGFDVSDMIGIDQEVPSDWVSGGQIYQIIESKDYKG